MSSTPELITIILSSFGGAVVVLVGLSSYLGKIIATRISHNQNSDILHKLEALKSELAFSKSSYENQLEHIVGYYTKYYEHYRRCQQLAEFEAYGSLDKEDVCTRDLYMDEIDNFLIDWEKREPRLRLILPKEAFELHGQAIDAFNSFNKLVRNLKKNARENKKEIRTAFMNIHKVKELMEVELRVYLRTDQIA
jgi:hypothetical protein